MRVFRGAAERDRAFNARRAPGAAARRHRADDGEIFFAVGKLHPFGDDLTRPRERLMQGPQGT